MSGFHKGFNPQYGEDSPSSVQISTSNGYILLEFGAPWCGHCQAAEPAVREVMGGYPELAHIKVYDGKGKRLGREFRVKLWPTLILLNNGSEVGRVVRPVRADEVLQLLSVV